MLNGLRIKGPNTTKFGGTLNPPSFDGSLDFARCAQLHNYIVRRGAVDQDDENAASHGIHSSTATRPNTTNPEASIELLDPDLGPAPHNYVVEHGSDLDEIDLETISWWDRYGHQLKDASTKLHPDIIAFLKSAWSSWKRKDGAPIPDAFFLGLEGIPPPVGLFEIELSEAYFSRDKHFHDIEDVYNASDDPDSSEDEEEEREILGKPAMTSSVDLDRFRFVTLYAASATPTNGSKPGGLVYDQKRQRALYVHSRDDLMLAVNAHTWRPLEHYLDMWHCMLDRQKVISQEGVWHLQPFAPADLREALYAWHDLIDSIEAAESQIPQEDRESPTEAGTAQQPYTLLESDAMADLSTSSFRYQFLTRARRPKRVHFIAPGLEIPSAVQLERDNRNHIAESPGEQPLLILQIPSATRRLTQQVSLVDSQAGDELLFPHAKNISPDSSFAPGLYLSSTGMEAIQYADCFRLVLPFSLCSDGQARFSDGAVIPGLYAGLYQQGYDKLGGGTGGHDAQLATLLGQWKKKLGGSSGWSVSEAGLRGGIAGVVQGIDVFKDADTWDQWGNYQLPGTLAMAGL